MSEFIKPAKDLLDDFFLNLKDVPAVDSEIAELITNLYKEGKLTDVNLKNGLENIRNKKDVGDENTEH